MVFMTMIIVFAKMHTWPVQLWFLRKIKPLSHSPERCSGCPTCPCLPQVVDPPSKFARRDALPSTVPYIDTNNILLGVGGASGRNVAFLCMPMKGGMEILYWLSFWSTNWIGVVAWSPIGLNAQITIWRAPHTSKQSVFHTMRGMTVDL